MVLRDLKACAGSQGVSEGWRAPAVGSFQLSLRPHTLASFCSLGKEPRLSDGSAPIKALQRTHATLFCALITAPEPARCQLPPNPPHRRHAPPRQPHCPPAPGPGPGGLGGRCTGRRRRLVRQRQRLAGGRGRRPAAAGGGRHRRVCRPRQRHPPAGLRRAARCRNRLPAGAGRWRGCSRSLQVPPPTMPPAAGARVLPAVAACSLLGNPSPCALLCRHGRRACATAST